MWGGTRPVLVEISESYGRDGELAQGSKPTWKGNRRTSVAGNYLRGAVAREARDIQVRDLFTGGPRAIGAKPAAPATFHAILGPDIPTT